MACIEKIQFKECEDIKCVEVNVQVENEGKLLRVPVYIRNVYPCREIIVGVRVYVEGRLYAMKTKKIFTGGRRYCRKIDEFYVGCFEFLFIDTCQENICVDTLAHYIQ